MLTITEKDGLSWELVALLEVAAEEAGYSSPESFITEAAVKEAGKVLAKSEAKADRYKGKNNYVGEEDFPQEGFLKEDQLDLFGGDE